MSTKLEKKTKALQKHWGIDSIMQINEYLVHNCTFDMIHRINMHLMETLEQHIDWEKLGGVDNVSKGYAPLDAELQKTFSAADPNGQCFIGTISYGLKQWDGKINFPLFAISTNVEYVKENRAVYVRYNVHFPELDEWLRIRFRDNLESRVIYKKKLFKGMIPFFDINHFCADFVWENDKELFDYVDLALGLSVGEFTKDEIVKNIFGKEYADTAEQLRAKKA